jgi:hypothetical protein
MPTGRRQSTEGQTHGSPQDEYEDQDDFGEGADPAGSVDDETYDAEEGGEGEGQEAGEGEDLDPRELARRPRAARQIDETQELRRELEALRRDNELLRRTPAAPAQNGPREETDEEFNRRAAALDPLEAMAERQQRAERRNNNQLLYLQASTQDALDKAQYGMRAATDKRFARYAEEVERRHNQFLMGGSNQPPALVPRETILKQILGERILSSSDRDERRRNERQSGRQPTTQNERTIANERPQQQRGRPLNTRGDAGGRGARMGSVDSEREARRKRIENVEI